MALKGIIIIQNRLCEHWANVSNLIYWGIKPFQLSFYQVLRVLETRLTTARESELKAGKNISPEWHQNHKQQRTSNQKPQMMFNSGLADSEMRLRRHWSSNPTINVPRRQASSRLKISDFVLDSILLNPGLDCRDGLGIILLLTKITRQWHDLEALIFS